ncbi:MAG: hypothetical protein WCK34_00715 [Bacteroidota bacterium]
MNRREFKNMDFSCRYNQLTLSDIIRKKTHTKKEKSISVTEPIPFNSLEEKFIPRMMQQEAISPNRFVWHVSEYKWLAENDLKRFSIATEGLKCEYSKYKAIFANNALFLLGEFYPFRFDFMLDWGSNKPLNDLTPANIVLHSDFWRIDTHACDARWHIDPNLVTEYRENEQQNRHYICTSMDIPPYALRLYKVKLEVYRSKLLHNLESSSSVFPLSLLRPDERVNNWINRSKQAA